MLTAPKMQQYIEYYENTFSEVMKLDSASRDALMRLFDAASRIAPDENGHKRRFYFYLPKGDFEDYKELHDGTEEELRTWFDREEDAWFDCTLVKQQLEWEDEPFYGVYLNNAYVLGVGDHNEVEWPETDATEFIEDLIWVVKNVVKCLRLGTYNDLVRQNLAYYMKSGTVSRADYWAAYPEEKEHYAVSDHARDILMRDFTTNKLVPKTAREYYEACAVCYDALDLKDKGGIFTDTDEETARYGGVTPKERYYRYADGRDDGLQQVDLDSEEDFAKWLRHDAPYEYAGGHPFEIMFSFTGHHSVHLYILDEQLYLSGGNFPANMMALKMYVALIDHGYNVEFANREAILARVNMEDRIGIKPWFSYETFDDDVLDVIDLDSDSYPKLKDKITWFPIREVKLN